MALRLTDPSATYELKHPSGAVFTMKHWTIAMQEIVDKSCLEQDGKGGYKWNLTKDRELKIEMAVAGWTGIEDAAGNPMDCSSEAKKMLPVGVLVWIFREVEERAGLRMAEAEKKS